MPAATISTVSKKYPGRKPVWDMALLFPDQGAWSEDDYLELTGNQLVEFTNGFVEMLPMPDPYHQLISSRIYDAVNAVVKPSGLGLVFYAPVPLRVGLGKYREPDLLYVSAGKLPKSLRENRRLPRADLVVEIVSKGPENRYRDYVKKRKEYAAARIPEYWIVDPENAKVTVLKLRSGKYVVSGQFAGDDSIQSSVLPDVDLQVGNLLS